jgi:hypothetical protein
MRKRDLIFDDYLFGKESEEPQAAEQKRILKLLDTEIQELFECKNLDRRDLFL